MVFEFYVEKPCFDTTPYCTTSQGN